MLSNHSATAAVTDPHEWHRIGLAHLQAGRMDEAAHALEEAERRGYADAAAALGTAYRRLGRQADAERAYLRALERAGPRCVGAPPSGWPSSTVTSAALAPTPPSGSTWGAFADRCCHQSLGRASGRR